MSEWIPQLIESCKHLGAKMVTAAGAYLVAQNGLSVVWSYFLGDATMVEVRLLLLGAGYACWTQAIIPFVEAAFNDAKLAVGKGGPIGRAVAARTTVDYFKIL